MWRIQPKAILCVSFLAILISGCQGQGFAVRSVSSFSDAQGELSGPAHPVEPDENWQGLKICSDLDFDHLDWSESLKPTHREPFALALNVTGTFEGVAGWQNLTGNFDGQGISMGLLQQNLGQGSLQPIWLDMFIRYPESFLSFFNSSQISQIHSMLDRWNSYSMTASLRLSDYGYGELDDPERIAYDLNLSSEELNVMTSALATRNQESVDWAQSYVLSGTSIKSDWSSALKSWANSSGYRSLQVKRAEAIHQKALTLFETYQMTQLRSYLVFFDIVVQNGGIPSRVYEQYQDWLKENSSSSEYAKMKKLIELRVALSKPQWQADVRSRKMALLDGIGTVHGSSRDFDKEYCTDIRALFPL